MRLKPDEYKKNIFEVNYEILKKDGIKAIFFDLDNTIIDEKEQVLNDKVKQLFNRLKKDFYIAVVSDTLRDKKVKKMTDDYDVEIITHAIKPFSKGFKKLKRINEFKSTEICMIGDQLLTDVFAAKRHGYKSVLVDCISKDIEMITGINRIIEKHLFKKYNLTRGKYYE